jgi:hypothetical protein
MASMNATGILCYCRMHCPDGNFNGTCLGAPNSMCFAAAEQVYNDETGGYESELSYGCMPPDEAGLMQVRSQLILS